MAKKRKTKEEKMLADSRHFLYHIEQDSPPALDRSTPKAVPTLAISSTVNFEYLRRDLIKTAIVTSVIIFSQALIYLMLRKHAIVFPGISY